MTALLSRRRLLAVTLLATALSALGPTRSPDAAEPPKKPAPPPAGDSAKPDEIVRNLYDRYAAGVLDYMEDTLRPRYFTKETDTLLKRVFDKSTKDDEPGIDYEPLIDGQDGDVKALTVVTTVSTPAKATVEARFTSLDDKVVISFEFLLEKSIWKIDDIKGKDGTSLKSVARAFLQ